MNRTKAIILAAGTGSRLRPLTDRVPKCLVPVAGRPMLDFWADALIDAGVRDVLLNTHHLPDEVRQYLRRVNRREVLRMHETYEPALLGSAGTLTANAEFAADADEIILIYADNLSDVDLRQMLAFHRSHGDGVTMLLFRAPDPKACGIAELDGEGRVISFVEKPAEPKSDLANAGVYIFSANAFSETVAMKVHDIGRDVLPRFVGRMRGWAGAGYHLDVGTPVAYERAQKDGLRILAGRGFDPATGLRPAIFLDRDGTLIESVHYLTAPSQVKLVKGAAAAVAGARSAGFACVLVSNQSAVGRGLMTDADLRRVHDEMLRQLYEEAGAALDGIYHCPVVPEVADRTIVEHPDRKPGPGMLLRAGKELSIDLGRSWIIGDMISDALAGKNAGCRGAILLHGGSQIAENDRQAWDKFPAMATVADAIEMILKAPAGVGPVLSDATPASSVSMRANS